MENKKGVAGVNFLTSSISGLFGVAILVMVIMIVASGIATTLSDDTTVTGLTQNGSTVTNTSATDLTGCSDVATTCSSVIAGSVVAWGNQTDVLNSANYTISDCTITATSTSDYLGELWNITYNYQHGDQACSVINESASEIAGIVDWFSTFIVIIAAAVVMGFVAVLFFFMKKSGLSGNRGA